MSFIKTGLNKLYGISGILLIVYVCAVFFLKFFDTYGYGEMFKVFRESIIVLVASIYFCPKILRFFEQKSFGLNRPSSDKAALWKFGFFAVFFVWFSIRYLTFYPGVFFQDSISQYEQALTGNYNDWHPVLHTLLTFKLPLLLTGGWTGSIVLFQITVLSVVLAYSFNTILIHSNKIFTIVCVVLLMLDNRVFSFAISALKDTAFAICALLLMTYAMKIYFSKGEWINKPLNIGALAIVLIVATVLRHNAVLFTVPLMIAVAMYINKKKLFLLVLCAVVLFAGIKGPLYTALDVEQPGSRQVEVLGLPMTVIGAVAKYDYDALDEETKQFVDKIGDRDLWQKYWYGSYNSIKFLDETNNAVIEEYGVKKVLPMMVRAIISSPMRALTGLIKLTCDLYFVNYETVYLETKVADNDVGLEQQGLLPLSSIYDYLTFLLPIGLFSTGTLHLLLIIAVLSKCKFKKFADWKKALFILPIFAYNFGTMLLLTGSGDSPRFFFYTALLVPCSLVILFNNEEKVVAQ